MSELHNYRYLFPMSLRKPEYFLVIMKPFFISFNGFVNGFVFTNPNLSDAYRHYAIKREGNTIYYVDSNGATWSETKTKTLKQYQPPKGYRDMTAIVEQYQ